MERIAQANFAALRANPYPGRGLIVGTDDNDENVVQVYWIMGRSPNSRNRVFCHDGAGRLFTEAHDPSKVQDPRLIIYNAMNEVDTILGRVFVVSNGHQTDALTEGLRGSRKMADILVNWEYEPDSPNFTPRISAISHFHGESKQISGLSILRKSGDQCLRLEYCYQNTPAGYGRCLTTYSGDGNPLPAFQGEPLIMPLRGNIEEVANRYWAALNVDNRVALAVKFISTHTKTSQVFVINRLVKGQFEP